MSDLSLNYQSTAVPSRTSRTQRIWEEIALQLREEQNPIKMVALWRDLDEALLEEEDRSRMKSKPLQGRVRSKSPITPCIEM